MEKIGYDGAQVSMKIWIQRQEESVGELSMVMGVSLKWIWVVAVLEGVTPELSEEMQQQVVA